MTTLAMLAAITFLSMMSPGPDMLLVLRNCTIKSRWPVVMCILGICAGLSIQISFAILGIAAIIAASTEIYFLLKIVGASYLVYIGIKSLRESNTTSLELDSGLIFKASNNAFKDGFLCNLLNPKVTIFILAVFTQLIVPSSSIAAKIGFGGFIIIEAFLVWYIFSLIVRTKLVLSFLNRFQGIINKLTGVALITFGGILAVSRD